MKRSFWFFIGLFLLLLVVVGVILVVTKRNLFRESFQNPLPTSIIPHEVHVCLTTIPERLVSTHFQNVIRSLLRQQFPIKRIILNIPHVFQKTGQPYPDIPAWIKKQEKIVINRCDDQGPATKLLGSFELIPEEDVIVIVDDDIIYREECIQRLYQQWQHHPEAVISHAIMNRESFKEVMGFGGYMFQKKVLNGILNYPHPTSCMKVDDTWISAFLSSHHIPVIKTPGRVWSISAYQDKTDQHPKWDELCNDEGKNNIIAQCIQDMSLI